MTRVFALKLLERVAITFLVAFAATYVSDVVGANSIPQLGALTDLSIAHKALAAAVAAVTQLIMSTLVAPHVGDPNEPNLVPVFLLRRAAAAPSVAAQVVQGAVVPVAKEGE